MARLRILQHHPAEGPGAILDWARSAGHTLRIVQPQQEPLPRDDRDIDATLLLGGPWCAFADDRPDWLRREQQWLRERIEAGMPAFAICLGAQLVAQALGGAVRRMPAAETGWVAILAEQACADGEASVESARAERLEVLQWHEDRFDLPPGCLRIARNADAQAEAQCPVQGYASRDGRIVGLQFHPEWTADSVAALHAAFGDDCPLPKTGPAQQHLPMHAWLSLRLDRWLRDIGVP
jgi:GMP synthase-like glutamine amidotransferase